VREKEQGQPELRGSAAAHVAPGDRAISAALRGLVEFGEAQQIVVVGRTGAGKTEIAKALCRGWLAAQAGKLIVLDQKAERRYDDVAAPELVCVRESVSDYKARPPLPGNRVIIFRARAGQRVNETEVSRFGWALARKKIKTCTMRDELVPYAANHMQWLRGCDTVQEEYITGRSWGRTLISLTTAFNMCPLECADNADRVITVQTKGQAIGTLRDREYMIGLPPNLLQKLKGKEAPPEQRGEFVELISGVPWNGTVYRLGARG
jgi:energy-coupling factor transporter ATP-binding protein EcfA2